MVIVLCRHQNQRSGFSEVDVVLKSSVFCSWRDKKRLGPVLQKVFNPFLVTGIKALRCTTIVNKGVYQNAERTLLPVVQSHWFGSSHPYVTPLVSFPNFLTFYFLNPVLLFIQDQVRFRIHLFQKTLSERTVNGSCRTEIARPKGTVVSILDMQKQWVLRVAQNSRFQR